jgi:hypothetical protein
MKKKNVKKWPKSYQKMSEVVKICDNCISIKSGWGDGWVLKVIPRPLADSFAVGRRKKRKK